MIPDAIFDSSLRTLKAHKRNKRNIEAFNFIEKGTVVQALEDIKKIEAQSSLVKRKVNKDESNPEIDTAKRLGTMVKQISSINLLQADKKYDPVPRIEWWDKPFIDENQDFYVSNEFIDSVRRSLSLFDDKDATNDSRLCDSLFDSPQFHSLIINHINSTPIKAVLPKAPEPQEGALSIMEESTSHFFAPKLKRVVIPTRLIKEEKVKLAKARRKEFQKELQEKIKYGLIPPPPPKVKISNFMRIYGTESIQDPTMIEKEVRKQIKERQDRHLKTNETRKLTKEAKSEKINKKLKKDESKEIRMCLFSIKVLYSYNY